MFRCVATMLVGILLSVPLAAAITPSGQLSQANGSDNGTSLYVRVGGKVRQWYCCMDSVIRETCGNRWQWFWRRTIP